MNGIYLGVLALYLLHAVTMHRHHGPETGEETQLHRGMPAPLMPFALFLVYQGLSTPSVAALVLSPITLTGGGILLLMIMLNQLRRKYRESDSGGALQRLFYVSGGMLQTVLLAMACYAAVHDGVLGRGLFDPVWVIMGLLAGHLIFGVSLLFSHRSLTHYRVPFFLPFACWFATAGTWTRIHTGRLWACIGYSLLIGLFAGFWEKWIYVLPYRAIWFPAGERPKIPSSGAPIELEPLKAWIMYFATIVILTMEIVMMRLAVGDMRRSAQPGPEAPPLSDAFRPARA